ncbi:hypothetical protein BJX76DRAFT_353771 [Aspergillus varians]
MAFPQIPHQYPISSFNPSGQMYYPTGEGPSPVSHGGGHHGAGNNPRRQGPDPRYTRGNNKWNASAPAKPARNGGRDGRQHAYPPWQNNLNNNYTPNGPGQGHNNYNKLNPSAPNGNYQSRRRGSQTHQHNHNCNDNNNYNNRNTYSSNGNYQPRVRGSQNHHNNDHRYHQGVFGRKNPKPVVNRALDFDNDCTMTGMPFLYTAKQWRRIQHLRSLRERQLYNQLYQELYGDNLDSPMVDAPASVPGHAHPVYSDLDMLEVPDDF